MTRLEEITYVDWQPMLNQIGEAAEGIDDINQCIANIIKTRKGSVHQSITDVTITSPSPGIIYVYPLTSNGNPSEELIKKVQDYLNDDKVRPLTD